jgi:4-amino-4-deoxy-L-arabinose transferase-like glycosyltransferase
MSVGTLARGTAPAAATQPLARAAANRRPLVALVALTLAAAALRLWRLGHQGFWFDEGNTALLVHFSPGKMLGLIPQTESTPPLYYCLAWVWARVFGYGETGLRSLSALCGVATVPVAYLAAQRLLSRRAAVIAAALVATSPFLIWYSQEARSYALLALLSALTLLAFARVRDDPAPGRAVAWVTACALALATHYYAVLVIAGEAVALLVAHRRRRPVQVALAALGACGAALIPLAISQTHTGHSSWIAHVSLGLRMGQIPPQFVVGTGAPVRPLLWVVSGCAVAMALLCAIRLADRVERARLAVPAAFVAGGLALNLALIAAGIDDLITRNLIALFIPALLALAGAFAVRRSGAMGLVGAVALCAVGVTATAGVALDRKLQRPDWRGVARVLGPRPAAGAPARAILIQHYKTLLPLSLYETGLRRLPAAGVRVSELDVIAIHSPPDPFCWWGAACNLSDSGLPSRLPINGFTSTAVRRVYQFSLLTLRAPRPVLLTPRMVSRVLRTTTLRRDELLLQPPR